VQRTTTKHEAGISQPAPDWGKSVFCLAPPPSDDLINPLFRDTECLGETGPSFTRFVSCPDFFITSRLRRHQIVLRLGWEWGIVEHLHNVKSSQPNVEASCGVEPPMGHYGARLASPLEALTSRIFISPDYSGALHFT
jgi:hypothetical protein